MTTQTTKTVLITGNTFPVKDQIKALGGKWDAYAKGWLVPADKADEARALVGGAPAPAPRPSYGGGYRGGYANCGNIAPGGRRCPQCGSRECAKAWSPRDLCDED